MAAVSSSSQQHCRASAPSPCFRRHTCPSGEISIEICQISESTVESDGNHLLICRTEKHFRPLNAVVVEDVGGCAVIKRPTTPCQVLRRAPAAFLPEADRLGNFLTRVAHFVPPVFEPPRRHRASGRANGFEEGNYPQQSVDHVGGRLGFQTSELLECALQLPQISRCQQHMPGRVS